MFFARRAKSISFEGSNLSMKVFKRAMCLALGLMTAASLAACSSSGSNAVVATVDGVEIKRWEVDLQFEQNIANYTAIDGIDPVNNPQHRQAIRESILEELITDTAINLEAEEMGYGLTDAEKAEVDAEYAAMRERAVASYAEEEGGDLKKGEKAYLEYLKENYLTEEALINNMYNVKMRTKLSDDMYADIVSSSTEVEEYYQQKVESDKAAYSADLSAYEKDNAYDSLMVMYHPENYVRFKQVFIAMPEKEGVEYTELRAELSEVDTELTIMSVQKGEEDSAVKRLRERKAKLEEKIEKVRQDGLGQIREKAEELLARAQAGEDFDALVAQYGEDTGMMSDPYKTYGYLICEKSEDYDPVIRDAVLALDGVGAVSSELTETDYGYHIFLIADEIEKGPRPLEEVRALIEEIVLMPQRQDVFNDFAADALEGREVERYINRL